MKTLAITLFISAFLVSSIYCDPCADAFAYADMSINRLRSNFVVEQYPNMFEDFEDIMKSAELIQETCAENVEFAIESHQFYTCSMAYVMLSELLDNYVFHHGDMISTLSQIVGLIPTIEGKICLDEWEVTAMQKQQDMGDEFWSDHDATDDYDYDKSDNYDDNFLVEDEEDEDTGDEIHSDSDEETGETAVWADDDEDEKIEFSSDISTDYDDDDENENEEEDDIDDVERDEDEETIVMIQEVANEEEPLMVFVDLSNEADATVEVEEEALLTHEIPAVTKEDEEMLKVFVKMTNMANMENEEFSFEVEEEETFSTYANISGENGEYALEIDNGDGSVFVYVDINTVLGADEVVNAIFADGQDDIEMEVSEMDLQQYWDDEEDGDDY